MVMNKSCPCFLSSAISCLSQVSGRCTASPFSFLSGCPRPFQPFLCPCPNWPPTVGECLFSAWMFAWFACLSASCFSLPSLIFLPTSCHHRLNHFAHHPVPAIWIPRPQPHLYPNQLRGTAGARFTVFHRVHVRRSTHMCELHSCMTPRLNTSRTMAHAASTHARDQAQHTIQNDRISASTSEYTRACNQVCIFAVPTGTQPVLWTPSPLCKGFKTIIHTKWYQKPKTKKQDRTHILRGVQKAKSQNSAKFKILASGQELYTEL